MEDSLRTVAHTLTRIPISRTGLYALFASGELQSVKVGGRRFVPESAINEYIGRLRDRYPDVDVSATG